VKTIPAVVFVEDWQVPIEENEDAVNAFLVANKSIQPGQTYRDVSEKLRAQIAARPEALIAKATAKMEVAA
jgi:hypothetical protein